MQMAVSGVFGPRSWCIVQTTPKKDETKLKILREKPKNSLFCLLDAGFSAKQQAARNHQWLCPLSTLGIVYPTSVASRMRVAFLPSTNARGSQQYFRQAYPKPKAFFEVCLTRRGNLNLKEQTELCEFGLCRWSRKHLTRKKGDRSSSSTAAKVP